MKDKRDECGCHRECTVLEHLCDSPCQWPKCLSEAEEAELMAEVFRWDPETLMTPEQQKLYGE